MSNMQSAGDFDRQIQFIGYTSAQDSFGQLTNTPVVLMTVRAQRRRLWAADLQRAQVLSEVVNGKYRTRYHAGITNAVLIRDNGSDYPIISVEVIGRNEGLEILVRAAQ